MITLKKYLLILVLFVEHLELCFTSISDNAFVYLKIKNSLFKKSLFSVAFRNARLNKAEQNSAELKKNNGTSFSKEIQIIDFQLIKLFILNTQQVCFIFPQIIYLFNLMANLFNR